MTKTGRPNTTVAILGVDAHLADDLTRALELNGCRVDRSPHARESGADLVFCSSELAVLREVIRLNPGRPTVVVSRLPETAGWLDALESGATDYCAAPFEPIHLRWMVETHLRPRRSVAAA